MQNARYPETFVFVV